MDSSNIKLSNNEYIVFKQDGYEEITFGVFDDLKTAIKHRDYYRRYKWNDKLKETYNPEDLEGEVFEDQKEVLLLKKYRKPVELMYIYENCDGSYYIKKTLNDKAYYFGRYSNLKLAKQARDYFKGTGWKLEDRLLFSDMKDTKDYKKDYWDSKELY